MLFAEPYFENCFSLNNAIVAYGPSVNLSKQNKVKKQKIFG